jgi:nucleotide-binding universal stress UspA family protein
MKKAKRILIGLKTLDHAVELTNLACRLGARGASLFLVHIIELPDPTPLDAEVPDLEATAKKILRSAERVASRSEMKVNRLVLRAHDAGPALLDEMKGKKVELAVIGYHHRRTLGEILLGTTALHLARHAPCHLVIDIPPGA